MALLSSFLGRFYSTSSSRGQQLFWRWRIFLVSAWLLLSWRSSCSAWPSVNFVPHLGLQENLSPTTRTTRVSSTSRYARTETSRRVALTEEDQLEPITTATRRKTFLTSLMTGSIMTTIVMTAKAPNAEASIAEKARRPLSEEDAIEKFKKAYETITYLRDNYNDISDGGGDNVRRYLGTVVSNPPSGMVGVENIMKSLEGRADDFVEYTELSEEVIKSVKQADGSAYMAIFVVTSTSTTPPSKYFSDAKIEINRCIKSMEEMASMIDIKL